MNTATKILAFDMDGTIADLYAVPNWLQMLHSYDPTPYKEARPLVDMRKVSELLETLQSIGYRVVIISWLAGDSTSEYDRAVRMAKREWLTQYGFPYDEIHLVKYGTDKASTVRRHREFENILFDDNAKVRESWERKGENFTAINATDIIETLQQLLINENLPRFS